MAARGTLWIRLAVPVPAATLADWPISLRTCYHGIEYHGTMDASKQSNKTTINCIAYEGRGDYVGHPAETSLDCGDNVK